MRNVAWTVGTNMAALRTLKISWWIEAEINSNLFGTLRWVRTHPNEVSASDTEHAVVFGNHVRISPIRELICVHSVSVDSSLNAHTPKVPR